MSFFTNAHNTVISAHHVTMNAYGDASTIDSVREGFNILCQNTTSAALYGSSISGKNTGCLPGTRINVRDHIFKWLNDPNGEVAMWMYGPAGIGKTAIAQTVAKVCRERAQLSSSFFFFRSDEGRNSAKHLVPTLAYGLLQQMPHTRSVVCTTIVDNPLILSAPLDPQIRTIILPAVLEPFPPSQDTLPGSMLFIIDGLDECTDSGTQQLIIQSFMSLLATARTAIRHRILIISRPESHIVSTFSAVDIARHVHHLCLDEWRSIADIEIFLHAELQVVKQTHPLKSYIDALWPSDNAFKRLLRKSFESFAYATLAVRYISSHDRHPKTSLNSLLGLSSDHAYEAHAELDTLYHHVLKSLDANTRYTVRKILCFYTYLSVGDIKTIGFLLGEATFVIELAMTKVSSVVRLDKRTHTISYYHTSFNDFLVDKERSGALYLYSPDVASMITKSLSRIWMCPTTADDYRLLEAIGKCLCNNINAGDMHIHILTALLETQLPTTIVVPQGYDYRSITRTFSILFTNISIATRSEHYPEAMRSLFCKALQYLAAWLGSQAGGNHTLETILDAIFMPDSAWGTDNPHAWDIIFDIVRRAADAWPKLCQLLPREETWEICAGMVKRYLAMPPKTRFEDMLKYFKGVSISESTPLTGIVIIALESGPTRAEVCRMLEQIVLEAMSDFPREIYPHHLISLRLCENTWDITQFPTRNVWTNRSSFIAKAMDQYIRKTHSESHLPYMSDDVRRLYCDSTSDAAHVAPEEFVKA